MIGTERIAMLGVMVYSCPHKKSAVHSIMAMASLAPINSASVELWVLSISLGDVEYTHPHPIDIIESVWLFFTSSSCTPPYVASESSTPPSTYFSSAKLFWVDLMKMPVIQQKHRCPCFEKDMHAICGRSTRQPPSLIRIHALFVLTNSRRHMSPAEFMADQRNHQRPLSWRSHRIYLYLKKSMRVVLMQRILGI